MSYIPDCRTDETYNEKFLKGDDKEYVAGFDYCVEMGVDNFFDNLDIPFSDESHIAHMLSEEVPESMRETYTVEFAFKDEEPQERTVRTYADLLRLCMLRHIECERNELITSMLDSSAEDVPVTDDISKV